MTTIFERYNQADNFYSTNNIWRTQDDSENFYKASILSISYFCLNVIANAHNNVMADSNSSAWIKVPAIMGLEAATLSLTAFATVETVIRLALTIITSPLFVTMACLNLEEGPALMPLLFGVSSLFTGATALGTLPMMYALATATENIDLSSD